MRLIKWLHISDIHLHGNHAWSQDMVLKAMCERIAREGAEGKAADFILLTGDLAFSGKEGEYALAAAFLDALCTASGVSKEHIFCVPGNHDIDRDRQRLCFQGARTSLQSQNQIDALFAGGEDIQTLLKRQEAYRLFQSSYFVGQNRTWTDDGLAYVSRLMIDDVHLAIVGLDSAWVAEGGPEDHGKLLLGERQVTNAIRLAQEYNDPPHIIVGMAHHPFHLLRDFDRRPAQDRIERAFQFFHCGHLHQPEARTAGFCGTGCLTLTAGASFETRQFNNCYSFVALDLLRSTRTVMAVQYDPNTSAFAYTSLNEYPVEVTQADMCSVSDLAQGMILHCISLAPWAHYLSALLLDQKADLPLPAENGYPLGSFNVLQSLSECPLKRKTVDFMTFRNALRVLYKRIALDDIFARHGAVVVQYGEVLNGLSKDNPTLRDRLAAQEFDAQMLASTEVPHSFFHTSSLLTELASAQEWSLLRKLAQRYLETPDQRVALQAKRMLALSLAHSAEVADKDTAVALYRTLSAGESAESNDEGNLAQLLIETGKLEDAKAIVLEGIGRFPLKATYFAEIGHAIVEATGDREFRRQIEATVAEGGAGA